MQLITQHAELLLILACVFGFVMAWSIGANDVANAMGTSVGSGAVRIWQAVLIAGVFEFLGAWLAGGQVTQTISSGLIQPQIFAEQPDVLVLGMLAALLGAATFLILASWRGVPVSTGQSIVGAVLGFVLVSLGASPVHWATIGTIVISWIASPLIAGAVAFVLFESVRALVLNHASPADGARRFVPYYIGLTGFVIALVTLVKGLTHIGLHLGTPASIFIAIAFGLTSALGARLILNRIRLSDENSLSERFRNVERVFAYAQLFTAATMAFAHGANDVANAIGPVAAVVSIINSPGSVSASTELASWVLVLGGAGIVVGLASYGRQVMRTIGSRITELTPTRGFCAELGAATTVVLATWFGIPVSTTQTLVGAVLGVGLARGLRALDLSVLGVVFGGWLLTLPGAAFFAAVYYFVLRALLG